MFWGYHHFRKPPYKHNLTHWRLPLSYAGSPVWLRKLLFLASQPQLGNRSIKMVNWRIIPVSKWLITMVIVSPQRIGWFPLPMAFGIPSSKYTQIIENLFPLPLPSCSIQSSGDQVSHPAWRIEAERMSLQQHRRNRIKSGICFQRFPP